MAENGNGYAAVDPCDVSLFDGKTAQMIGYRLLSFFVCVITLGIAYPWMHCMMQRWETKHTIINGRRLTFDGSGAQLIGKYLLWVFLTIITLGIYGIWLGLGIKKWTVKHTRYADESEPIESRFSGGPGGFLGVHLLAFLFTLVTFGIGRAWAEKNVLKWEAKHTHIGGSPMVFNGSGGQLFVKYLLFVLLTPITLGIYALFFPVKLLRWRVAHTQARYRTPEIREKARAHESGATQDYAKYRLAGNDRELAAVKSGFSGREDVQELERMVAKDNPYAAYGLAVLLKGDAPAFEGRALELLECAAGAKYYPALLALAGQQSGEQALHTLTDAAKNGSAEACWILADRLGKTGADEEAAYWFRIALDWEYPEAMAHAEDYHALLEKIALKLSEGSPAPREKQEKQEKGKAGRIAVTVLLLIAGAAVVFAMIRWGGSWVNNRPPENIPGKSEPTVPTEPTRELAKVTVERELPPERIGGRPAWLRRPDTSSIDYVLGSNAFCYTTETSCYLYVTFGTAETDTLYLSDDNGWKSEPLTNGVLCIEYPADSPDFRGLYVETEHGERKFHSFAVLTGNLDDLNRWIEGKAYPFDPEMSVYGRLLGAWTTWRYDGEDQIESDEFIFYEDGRYSWSAGLYTLITDTQGVDYLTRIDGKYWLHGGGTGAEGEYIISNSDGTLNLYGISATDGQPTKQGCFWFWFEGDVLMLKNVFTDEVRAFEHRSGPGEPLAELPDPSVEYPEMWRTELQNRWVNYYDVSDAVLRVDELVLRPDMTWSRGWVEYTAREDGYGEYAYNGKTWDITAGSGRQGTYTFGPYGDLTLFLHADADMQFGEALDEVYWVIRESTGIVLYRIVDGTIDRSAVIRYENWE